MTLCTRCQMPSWGNRVQNEIDVIRAKRSGSRDRSVRMPLAVRISLAVADDVTLEARGIEALTDIALTFEIVKDAICGACPSAADCFHPK
jgi:hypothetical protein